jgi:hypothetical protein
MSCAEKRTWWTFWISLATVLVGTGTSFYVMVNDVDVIRDVLSRGLGVLSTIPLIAIVVLSRRFPAKDYDERDWYIESKAQWWGGMGGMGFLFGLALLLHVLDPLGSISTVALPWLAYLTYFTCVLFESGAGLLQYRYTVKGNANG